MKSLLYLGCPPSERLESQKRLLATGIEVIWADTVSAAARELQRRDVAVLLDVAPGAAALEMVNELRSYRPSAVVFVVVDPQRADLTTEAVVAGVADIFTRPLAGRRVLNALEREAPTATRSQAKPFTNHSGEDLYGHSPAMREVMELTNHAATVRTGVLIRGEDGTGRQVVARAIHAAAANGGPTQFVAVDCAAFDAECLDAELFGTPGRWQNGDADPRGLERVSRGSRLHAAIGGTLYLQNVVEAPTRVQARLSRVLRDREAILVQTEAPIALDVRPIAAADPEFDGALRDGRIREDLFRRVSAIQIQVPPLRNRREDIPALGNYFVRDICASLGLPPQTLSRSALSLMSALPWKGNAIELRALLEKVVVSTGPGRTIGLDDVLMEVKLDGGAVQLSGGGTLRQARAHFEREYIAAVLQQHHGRISEAAKTLGIQRTNLYRKMRTLRVRTVR